MSTPNYLNRNFASEYLLITWGIKRSPKYLAKLAVIGGGPPFRKAGRDPLYAPLDLDAWVEEIMGPVVRSTSELPSLPSIHDVASAPVAKRLVPAEVAET
jgi:hypothetical protein